MSVEQHIKNIWRSAYSEFPCITTIQHLLSFDSTKTLTSTFVLSRLDHCNLLLSGCPKYLLEKLQKNHVPPFLITLHWLLTQACIEYKLSTPLFLWYFSVYLSDFFHVYSPSRWLPFSDSRTPHIKIKTRAGGLYRYAGGLYQYAGFTGMLHGWYQYNGIPVSLSIPIFSVMSEKHIGKY